MSSGYRRQRNYYKKPVYKTKKFYIFLVLILAFVMFVYFSVKNTKENQPDEQKFTDQEFVPQMSAKLTFTDGKIEIKNEESSWQEIAVNYQIEAGSTVKTDETSKAIITLPDDSVIRMKEKSEVTFVQLGMSDIVLEQLGGNVFHRVNPDSTAIYKVKNDNAELTALGTGFNVLVSSHLTVVTVTESRVKAKIFEGETIKSVRTIDTGDKATLNPNKGVDDMITTDELTAADMMEDSWLVWNLEKDREADFFVGIFEETVPIVITEPEKAESTTDQETVWLKGETDPQAEIFIAGKEVDNNGGKFEMELLLGTGENEFEITVKVGKKMNKKTISITSTMEAEQITLSGQINRNEVNLSWETENLDDYKEFKIVQSKEGTPSYPADTYHSQDKNTTTDIWTDLDDGTHYFRICALDGADECVSYSNVYTAEIGEGDETPVGSINLSSTKNGTTINLNWSLSDDLTAEQGFMIVIGQESNPSYPGSSYHNASQNSRSDSWKNLSQGTYHFRVCLLKDDSCIIYSDNQSQTIAQTDLGSISLHAKKKGDHAQLDWLSSGISGSKGYKVMKSDQPNITFPSDHHLIIGEDSNSDIWENLTPGTHYFRVCESLSSSDCGVYSNEVELSWD
jgi:hypothetical protein